MLPLSGCARAETPPEVNLNGTGCFTAEIGNDTYTGRFALAESGCTAEVHTQEAAPVTFRFVGEIYTITSGEQVQTCPASAFPRDSVWRNLPELLRQLWADPVLPEQTGSCWQRSLSLPAGTAVLQTGAAENIRILLLPADRGRVILQFDTQDG